jgi:hypothetical protein
MRGARLGSAAVPLKDSREGFDDFIDRGNVGYDRRGDHRHRFSASLHDTLMARVEAPPSQAGPAAASKTNTLTRLWLLEKARLTRS